LRPEDSHREQARELLSAIYGWFKEGFDTSDLKEAKALIEELIWTRFRTDQSLEPRNHDARVGFRLGLRRLELVHAGRLNRQ